MEQVYVKDLLLATGGTLLCGEENTPVYDIVTDSRTLKKGDLFVPLKGEKVDAHRFLDQAVSSCSAAFTMEPVEDAWCQKDCALIAVEDTLTAMQQVAAMLRSRYQIPVIGVTGSVGKTTTREMIAKALSSEKKVFETIKNYNSQVGVPLTLAKLDSSYEIAVLEMGMSNFGEMQRLSDMVRPDTAVMTCIGVAHIEQLKTQENIRAEKLKIISHMKKEDVIYLNGDDPLLYACKDQLPCTIVWYGLGSHNDFRAENCRIEGEKNVFELVHEAQRVTVRLQAMGEHNVRNALVALAVSSQYGVALDKAAAALSDFAGQRQRIVKTSRFTMIDDTYNASPDSMRASLKVLSDFPTAGRKIAVLADMLELGPDTEKFHRQVGACVKENGIDYLITYGELARFIAEEAEVDGMHAESLEQVADYLRQEAKPEDVVLLKGSNGMNLKQVVKQFDK